jgi:hypothetical protein
MACIGGGEAPVDSGCGGIAVAVPGGDLGFQGRLVGDATIQALAVQYTQFDFSHVEPAPMFGRVVDLELCATRRCLIVRG